MFTLLLLLLIKKSTWPSGMESGNLPVGRGFDFGLRQISFEASRLCSPGRHLSALPCVCVVAC